MPGELEKLTRNSEPSLTRDQRELLENHLAAVLEANKVLNLTAIREYDEALRLHVLDSLAPASVLEDAPKGRILDLGSGAGYPGIPLAVVSGRETVLLEATRKKCLFLEQCAQDLGLSMVSVACGRAEELALEEQHAGGFSVVTARAVADLPVLVELAAPFLSHGGVFLALKGALADEELERGDRASSLLGMARVDVRRYDLPGGFEKRALVVYKKTGMAGIRVPRRIGMAKKKPLG